jgi:hypothetical protein
MRGIILIALGGAISIPATLNGNIVSAIILGASIGAILVLIIYYVLERLNNE